MKILMVCLGNICRSPLAEGIMRHKLKEKGIQATVDSAGTAAYHVGESPDPRSQEVARRFGVDLSGQKARKFVAEDFNRFDLIFAMDQNNYADMASLATSEDHLKKLDLILNAIYPDQNREVPDPYYGGPNGFEKVFHMLDASCEKIALSIASKS